MSIKTTTEMDVYELDGTATRGLDRPKLLVHSHWNDRCLVVVQTPDGKRFTVSASELNRAVLNGMR